VYGSSSQQQLTAELLYRAGSASALTSAPLGCDFFERVGEKRMGIRRFLGYVCQIAKVRVRMSFGLLDGSLFSPKNTFFYFFLRMRIKT